MKTENRVNHKWLPVDQYGISECEFCGCLMRKKANSNFALRKSSKITWLKFYSRGGTKWTQEHLPCSKVTELA